MSRFWARSAFLGFVLLAGAITANALYFQDAAQVVIGAARRSSADEHGDADSEQDSTVLARSELNSATAALPHETRPGAARAARGREEEGGWSFWPLSSGESKAISTQLVQAIQRELATRGYDPGRQDGATDARTRAAIIAFEFDSRLPLTGEPSEAVLKSILFGPVAGPLPADGAAERFETGAVLVRQVQVVLVSLGYSTEPVDGVMTEATRTAIRKFESDRNLPETGKLSAPLLLELMVVTGRSFDAAG